MLDLKALQTELDNARQEVRNLQVMQMKPGVSPEKLELLRQLERSARASVKLGRRAIEYQRLRDLGLKGGGVESDARYGDDATETKYRTPGTAQSAGDADAAGQCAKKLELLYNLERSCRAEIKLRLRAIEYQRNLEGG
jgi:hypothetical protein